jgi:hypothetical protein
MATRKKASSKDAARACRGRLASKSKRVTLSWIDRGPPQSKEELRELLLKEFEITVPREPMPRDEADAADHAALPVTSPLSYLWHALREEEGTPRDVVVWGPRGGGKTFYAAVATMLDLVFKPGVQVRILAGSLEQATRMLWHLRWFFEREVLRELVKGTMSQRRIALINGSRAEILAASETSVRGTRVQKIRCDEVELFDEKLWDAAQLATRSLKGTWSDGTPLVVRGSVEALSTMHVPMGLMSKLVSDDRAKRAVFRWGTLDVLERCGDEHVCGVSGSEDENPPPGPLPLGGGDADAEAHAKGRCTPCPLWRECRGRAKRRAGDDAGHVSIGDAISLKQRVSSATWESEMLCREPRVSGAVYPEFERVRHVTTVDPRERVSIDGERVRLVIGMDFGFAAPTAALLGAILPPDEHHAQTRLVIVEEHSLSGMSLDEHVRRMQAAGWPLRLGEKQHGVEMVAIDPAGLARSEQTGESNATVLRRMGLVVKTRRMRLAKGLEMVRALLDPAGQTEPRLVVHERCRKVIASLLTYRYAAEHARRASDSGPEKDGPDHLCDALRYLVTNLANESMFGQDRHVEEIRFSPYW